MEWEFESENYDDMDIEMVVLRGHGEEEDVNAEDDAFMRGYLEMSDGASET